MQINKPQNKSIRYSFKEDLLSRIRYYDKTDFTLNMTTKLNTQNDFIQAIKNRNYIIGSVTSTGTLSFADNPIKHTDPMSARAEVQRLSRLNRGKMYLFVELAGAELVPDATLSI